MKVNAEDDAVAPAGKPDICTETLDENPFNGNRRRVQSQRKIWRGGGAVTCTVRFAVCVSNADVPVRTVVVVVAAAVLAAVRMTV